MGKVWGVCRRELGLGRGWGKKVKGTCLPEGHGKKLKQVQVLPCWLWGLGHGRNAIFQGCGGKEKLGSTGGRQVVPKKVCMQGGNKSCRQAGWLTRQGEGKNSMCKVRCVRHCRWQVVGMYSNGGNGSGKEGTP